MIKIINFTNGFVIIKEKSIFACNTETGIKESFNTQSIKKIKLKLKLI